MMMIIHMVRWFHKWEVGRSIEWFQLELPSFLTLFVFSLLVFSINALMWDFQLPPPHFMPSFLISFLFFTFNSYHLVINNQIQPSVVLCYWEKYDALPSSISIGFYSRKETKVKMTCSSILYLNLSIQTMKFWYHMTSTPHTISTLHLPL